MLRIRHFVKTDQYTCRNLILDGLAEHFGVIDQTLNPDLNDIGRSYLDRGHRFLVAEELGVIVGTAALLLDNNNHPRIVRMSVAKTARRKGVASALLNDLIKEAARIDADAIEAHAEPDWTDAVGFYLMSGFQKVGEDAVDIHLRLQLEKKHI